MTFKDARIAVLEARMSTEMADLIRRHGGHSFSVPAVREVAVGSAQPVSTFIDHLSNSSLHTVVFFTGVGIKALIAEAEQLQRLPELLTALHNVTVVCRGPKPSAVLKRYDVPIVASAEEPYTTTELLAVLEPLKLAGTSVGVLHYGERNTQVTQFLRDNGANVEELYLYEWLLPEDVEPLRGLVKDIIAQHVDAIVFTSQVQVRHLFLLADELHLTQELAAALQTRTVVASIGPTCTGVLQSYGVTPHVIPEHPKMGHLIRALAEYMSR
ncbi:MAG: hypothetical protein NVS2B12_03930 [Ktedonobacteraceae bacterium]